MVCMSHGVYVTWVNWFFMLKDIKVKRAYSSIITPSFSSNVPFARSSSASAIL